MDLDPYEELGVDRTADEATIRKAFRKVVKQAHPDAGGTAEAYHKVTTALAVLTDPRKRKTFDETGRIEEDRPDNDRSAALQVVEHHVGAVVNAYIASGFNARHDPRNLNVVGAIEDAIHEEIDNAIEGAEGGKKVIAFMTDMRARFNLKEAGTGAPDDNPIARGLDRQIKAAQQQLSDIEGGVRIRRLALTIVGAYDFRWEEPAPPPQGNGYSFTISGPGFPDMRADDVWRP